MTPAIKNEETFKQNMHSLYAVVMSLCDSNMEDKIKAHTDYAQVKLIRNTITLLQVIKQYMYLNGSEELHTIQNQVLSTSSLFWMRQERGQSPQDFRHQFTATHQVCERLSLTIGVSKQSAKAEMKIEDATEQLKRAKEKTTEDFLAILFLCMAEHQKYSNFIEDMENAVLQNKNLFLKG